MKKTVLLFFAFLLLASSCRRGDNDPRLIVISFDGLRWSEVFGGADSAMLARPDYVKDRQAAEKYWRQTPAERREALLPFIWSYVPGHGYLVGNRWLGSRMDMANRMWFSYPGYNEMFCGFPDDERITSNKAEMNANTSVFEVANRDPRYAGRVAVYGSWTIIRPRRSAWWTRCWKACLSSGRGTATMPLPMPMRKRRSGATIPR